MTNKPDQALLQRLLIKDVHPLRSAWRKHGLNDRLQQRIERSQAEVNRRRGLIPAIRYPDTLPVAQQADAIADAIRDHQVVVVAGETGSGKTTQLPKICLQLGLGCRGLIGHTQPRRLAARTVAARIAEELGTEVGQGVGFQVRFSEQVSDDSLIKLMTDGVLLTEIQRDRFLNRYQAIIIDEAHERSLNIDFLLGYLKWLLPKRPDLKLIITSATIDVERFARHFEQAPVVEVSGRTYPVEVLYRPTDERNDDDGEAGVEGHAIMQAVREIEDMDRARGAPGDVLVFLPGERDIRETALRLRKMGLPNTEILPLYSRLGYNEQRKVFQPHGGRRIVLATNVAETSITVPGIRYVIDTGVARISRYSYKSKVQRLPIEPISQASANQRKGRCGRVSDGVCIRLYSETDFLSRDEYTDPEILRTNLASVILQMLHLKLGAIEDFPFINQPDQRFVRDGYKLLFELGAVDHHNRLTAIGRQLARIPTDTRLARMLIAAHDLGCLEEILIITSALSIQDPRERPADKQQAAREQQVEFDDEHSEFLAYVNLWRYYETQRQELSQNQLRKLCKQRFLSYLRMREWRDTHRQLKQVCADLGFTLNQEPASYEAIHKALLHGQLTLIAQKHDNKDYRAPQNKWVQLFPGNKLAKKRPAWITAAEFIETQRVYAATVARIEPEWLEGIGAHLVKRHYFEPHWSKKRGQVVGYERVTLYGLPLVNKRPIGYKQVDAATAREIFIRQALVEGDINTQAEFLHHNQAAMERIETLEDKARRRDILVDGDRLFAFYDERLPPQVCGVSDLKHWLKTAPKAEQQRLFITTEELMQHSAEAVTEAQFPDQLDWQGIAFPLSYHFEPGHPADGVTLTVPLSLLRQLPQQRLGWLVPGLLRDKCLAWVKGLPKRLRKNFVPVPDFVDAALAAMQPGDTSLDVSLASQLKRMTGVSIGETDWQSVELEPHFHFNIRVVDEQGEVLGEGRDYLALCAELAQQADASMRQMPALAGQERDVTQWDFGDLPTLVETRQAGATIRLYPTLFDETKAVRLGVSDFPALAEHHSREGVIRLLMLAMKQQVKHIQQWLTGKNGVELLYSRIGKRDALLDDFAFACFQRSFKLDPLPRDADAFNNVLQAGRAALITEAETLLETLRSLLSLHQRIEKQLKGRIALELATSLADIRQHLAGLIYSGFLRETPAEALQHYPRYLEAILMRLEKLPRQPERDRDFCQFMHTWRQKYQSRADILQYRFDPPLVAFRWMLEELQVSEFAQTLGVPYKISRKRIEKQWQQVTEVG